VRSMALGLVDPVGRPTGASVGCCACFQGAFRAVRCSCLVVPGAAAAAVAFRRAADRLLAGTAPASRLRQAAAPIPGAGLPSGEQIRIDKIPVILRPIN